ncbi:MAG: response regulator [Parvibaculum sp.]|jgi:DNA-binding response OmpR family regulator|nr:response regulator [Parvibaculum sp.]
MGRILVIDDDSMIRQTIRFALERSGFDVDEAESGVDGCRIAGEAEFDLVITDILMPHKDGIETIIELKRLRPGLRILAMSGGGKIDGAEFLNLAARLGVDGTIRKPFPIGALIKKAESLCRGDEEGSVAAAG